MPSNLKTYISFIGLGILFVLLLGYAALIQPPRAFPEGASLTIAPGTSVKETAEALVNLKAIRSPFAFELLVRLMSPENGVQANVYAFSEKENVFSLALRFVRGTTGITPSKVTIPEGLNSREIAELLREALVDFDEEGFKVLGKLHEGYLFPDTYFFLPGTSPEVVVQTMRENFNTHVGPLEAEILASGRSVLEIVTMASLLEEEARRPETRQLVAGILWKRIELGMPLQVDAVFGYILEKSGYAPNFDDLEVESPYNTYLYRGLPPGPISNPGLASIESAMNPIESEYLYYLTGADGLMYYAKTFEQHKANRSKLR